MLTESSFDTGAVVLNYAEGPPSGAPLVVLHGGSASWRYWQDLLIALAPRWHVYAPDLRGHGGSGHVPARYLLADYAADIAAFLDRGVGAPAVLFGHSLGGEVAVMVAARHPARVRALIVGDAPLSSDHHATEDPVHREMNVLWHALSSSGQTIEEIAAALREMAVVMEGGATRSAAEIFGGDSPWFHFQAENLHRLDPDMLAAVLEGPHQMLAGYDPAVLLPAITCPVLLLQAEQGSAMGEQDVALARTLLGDVTCLRLAGADHPLGTERVVAASKAFLQRIAAED